MELHFEADNDTGRTPLLLVHGLLSSRRHWLPNLKLSDRFRLVRVDLPAHGLSPAPIEGSISELVAALDAVRAALRIQRWHICGQSFGAGLTLRYAIDYPDRVIAQVFTNANGALRESWTEEQTREHVARTELIAQKGYEGLRNMPYHPVNARRFPDDIRHILTADADAIDLKGILKLLTLASPRLSVRDRIGMTSTPTLLINGLYEKQFQGLRSWLPNVLPTLEIVDLPGGHSINVEQPEAFNSAVCDFLQRHNSPGF
jgi:pimeloyl-ACP methyl ester carboxylesterase